MTDARDAEVLRSWAINAAPWARAIGAGTVRSRVLVTNAAIVEAVMRHHPRRVLDVGCGEGWLCRALQERGVTTVGVDAIPALVDEARRADPAGDYRVLTYEAIGAGALADGIGPLDVAVCNFSLIGEAPVEAVLAALAPHLAATGGHLVIQTLHPFTVLGRTPYVDGWRDGSWDGFSAEFTDPAPWFARTMSGWVTLLGRCGFTLSAIEEPLHPETGHPASLVLHGVGGR